MGESRTELLAWLNDLLQINYSKVEQCGTGAAYCQIIDSIYGNVPMSRVKMNAKHEYEFLANYKIMQNVFKANKIEKPIPVDKLVKCKMQDNLEFLQWIRRFWDQNYPGTPYDAVARRKGAPTDTPATIAPLSRPTLTTSAPARSGGRTPVGGRAGGGGISTEAYAALQTRANELQGNVESLEKERDFYFNKLRDIEIIVQEQLEKLERESKEDDTLKEIQKILYSTEEGFEVPSEQAVDEEETF